MLTGMPLQNNNTSGSSDRAPDREGEEETAPAKRTRLLHDSNGGTHMGLISESLIRGRGPLGLNLTKSPAVLAAIQNELNRPKGMQVAGHAARTVVRGRRPKSAAAKQGTRPPGKLQASNFKATRLKIGNWEWKSKYEGDLVAKLFFSKNKMSWEVLHEGLKSKMEIRFSDICVFRVTTPEGLPGTLDIKVCVEPQFFRETTPLPYKSTRWLRTSDFTGGQARRFRHVLQCAPGIMDKHIQNLFSKDHRLYLLNMESNCNPANPCLIPPNSSILQGLYGNTGANLFGTEQAEQLLPPHPMPIGTNPGGLDSLDVHIPTSVPEIPTSSNNVLFVSEQTQLNHYGSSLDVHLPTSENCSEPRSSPDSITSSNNDLFATEQTELNHYGPSLDVHLPTSESPCSGPWFSLSDILTSSNNDLFATEQTELNHYGPSLDVHPQTSVPEILTSSNNDLFGSEQAELNNYGPSLDVNLPTSEPWCSVPEILTSSNNDLFGTKQTEINNYGPSLGVDLPTSVPEFLTNPNNDLFETEQTKQNHDGASLDVHLPNPGCSLSDILTSQNNDLFEIKQTEENHDGASLDVDVHLPSPEPGCSLTDILTSPNNDHFEIEQTVENHDGASLDVGVHLPSPETPCLELGCSLTDILTIPNNDLFEIEQTVENHDGASLDVGVHLPSPGRSLTDILTSSNNDLFEIEQTEENHDGALLDVDVHLPSPRCSLTDILRSPSNDLFGTEQTELSHSGPSLGVLPSSENPCLEPWLLEILTDSNNDLSGTEDTEPNHDGPSLGVLPSSVASVTSVITQEKSGGSDMFNWKTFFETTPVTQPLVSNSGVMNDKGNHMNNQIDLGNSSSGVGCSSTRMGPANEIMMSANCMTNQQVVSGNQASYPNHGVLIQGSVPASTAVITEEPSGSQAQADDMFDWDKINEIMMHDNSTENRQIVPENQASYPSHGVLIPGSAPATTSTAVTTEKQPSRSQAQPKPMFNWDVFFRKPDLVTQPSVSSAPFMNGTAIIQQQLPQYDSFNNGSQSFLQIDPAGNLLSNGNNINISSETTVLEQIGQSLLLDDNEADVVDAVEEERLLSTVNSLSSLIR